MEEDKTHHHWFITNDAVQTIEYWPIPLLFLRGTLQLRCTRIVGPSQAQVIHVPVHGCGSNSRDDLKPRQIPEAVSKLHQRQGAILHSWAGGLGESLSNGTESSPVLVAFDHDAAVFRPRIGATEIS